MCTKSSCSVIESTKIAPGPYLLKLLELARMNKPLDIDCVEQRSSFVCGVVPSLKLDSPNSQRTGVGWPETPKLSRPSKSVSPRQ